MAPDPSQGALGPARACPACCRPGGSRPDVVALVRGEERVELVAVEVLRGDQDGGQDGEQAALGFGSTLTTHRQPGN